MFRNPHGFSQMFHACFFRCSLLLVVTVAFATGCAQQNQQDKAKQLEPTPIRTVAVTEETTERTTTQPATVHAYYRTEIRAKVSGYVKEVTRDIGDFVDTEENRVLALIAVPEMENQTLVLEARVARYQADEAQAKAGIALADAAIVSAEADLVQANSQLKGAAAALAAAEAAFSRTSDLVDRQSLQSRMLDEARQQRDTQLANQEAVQSSITAAEARVKVAEAKRAAAAAAVKSAEAETLIAERQLEELKTLMNYATISAPFAGVVTHRSVAPGDLVREGSEVGQGEPLFVVSQLDRVRIHIAVPERDAALVSKGDSVTLTFPSFPEEDALTAEVTRVAGELDPSTRTMLVEVVMENKDRKLLPGMFGQAKITLGNKTAANVLPARAIRFDESGAAYVYVVGKDDTVNVVSINTGHDDGKTIEVVSGVKLGDLVVDSHLKRFADGDKVRVLTN